MEKQIANSYRLEEFPTRRAIKTSPPGTMISARRCDECGTALDPAKILRCTRCKACFYCSAACQKRNWKLHKRVCSTDPLLRPFIRVEMAVERVLRKQPKVRAPKDAFCYICLEGEDGNGKSSKLMRGCACRGDSAGFVHLECLTKLAMSKEASGDPQVVFNGWINCGNCKQYFQGALDLEMTRRCWRRHRSSQDLTLRYNSTKHLALCLGNIGEVDAASQLLDDASKCVCSTEALLDLKLSRAEMRIDNGQKLEGLGLLQAMLPEATVATNPHIYAHLMHEITDVLLALGRYQEAHEAAAELVAFAKAKSGLEHPLTLHAMESYAVTCAKLGRVDEAKASFEYALATQTRVFGRDHPYTQDTLHDMRTYGFAEPSG